MPKTPFMQLYFGKSDARMEILDDDTDFLRSFVDLDNCTQRIIKGEITIILGPKGTGKSALGVYLERTSSPRYRDSEHHATMKNASRLPLAEIPQLNTGQPAGVQRTYDAWKFILLCNYLEVALSDSSARLPHLSSARTIIQRLRAFGFTGDESGKRMLQISKASIEISTQGTRSLFRREGNAALDIFTLLPYLEGWALDVRADKRHVVLLDGLDSMFLNDQKYDESLSALTQAAFDLNLRLRQSHSSGSLVLLIRNDIFSRVSLMLPDAHKMRDFGFDLDWRVLTGPATEKTPLMNLVNLKASQVLGLDVDVLSYFPSYIKGGGGQNPPTRLQYLLNLTRHTPRDMLQLMEYIRRAAASFGDHAEESLDEETIREGVVQYSTKYFVDAIRGEFAGYEGGPEEAQAAIDALKLMQRAQFTRHDYHNSLKTNSPGLEGKANEFLKLMFFAGALGNLFNTGGRRHLVFYHRRNDVDLNVQGTLILHNALTHAWSKQFGYKA